MARSRGIALRLSILILASITVIFSVVFTYNYFISRQIILQNVERNAENLALSTVARTDAVLRAVERVPKNLAYFLEEFPYEGGELIRLIQAVVEKNPDIYGATIAFEPYAYSPNIRAFAPYFYRKEGTVNFVYIPYEYFDWDWYQIPKELKAPSWTEPYFDEGAGSIMMATFSVPFYRRVEGERILAGIVTADVSLSWLQEMLASIKIEETGYGFVISRNGTFVTHPSSSLVMNETIFSVAEEKADPEMRELGRKMTRGESGFASFTSLHTGKECWMKYAPLPSNSWSVAVLFPKDELMADIYRLTQTVVTMGIVGFLFILVVIVWIAGSITRPLRALSRAVGHIGTGNLDVELPLVKRRDEVGTLAESFHFMKTSLKQYIAELKETTAAKERIESELKIAHEIQMSILPMTFPPFPHRREFDIYATIAPAKEVGGDLYDFFFLDEDHLCVAIGDVSGKGVPAALFMAVTRTLIKTKATQGLTPDKVLGRVNEDLALDNDSMMFVTLFLGILDTRTGELEYSNAGHNPPYVLRRGGGVELVEGTGGTALGVLEGCVYRSKKVLLRKGETIFLYTDGVTEAMDRDDALFSDERLIRDLGALHEKPPQEVLSGVMDRVKVFSEGAPQADDITILVLRYNGA
ncbi:MAG: SpoIIE family protein phosphatase [Deltaproteobacteria bacterium]|nr:SpoIIE family protein phosphatase [Deltaproteobacteria bacterium]